MICYFFFQDKKLMIISKKTCLAVSFFGAAAYLAYSYTARDTPVDEVAKDTFEQLNFNYKEYTQKNTRAIRARQEEGSNHSVSGGGEEGRNPVFNTRKEEGDNHSIADDDAECYIKEMPAQQKDIQWIDDLIRALNYEDESQMKITTLARRVKRVALNPGAHPSFVQNAVFGALYRVGEVNPDKTLIEYLESQFQLKETVSYPFLSSKIA